LEDEWAAHYSEFYTVEEQKRLARAQGEKLKGPDRLPSMTNFLIYIHLQRKNPPYSAADLSASRILETAEKWVAEFDEFEKEEEEEEKLAAG
jgi:hypothetical protein